MADDSQEQSDALLESGEQQDGSLAISDDDILKEAKERFDLCQKAEADIKSEAADDMKFLSGEQWPANVRQERNNDGRPCLVINRLPQFIQQVANDQRQNRPSIKVHPTDSLATIETAEVIQGLVRHIEYNSKADVAYDTAFEGAVGPGLGYFRVATDFASPESFEQEIFIRRVRNPLSVSVDPYTQEPDGSDATFAFVRDKLSKPEYKLAYPKSKVNAAAFEWQTLADAGSDWLDDESIVIAEYFVKDFVPGEIHQLSTGVTVTDEELQDHANAAAQAGIPLSIVQSREIKKPIIKWYKLNGVEILERGIFPGSYIPIIPVYGSELFVDGKRILKGIIRDAKDPQRMYNYWASAETEAIALAPKAPWVGVEGQFEGHEDEWATANKKNHAYLEYCATDLNGQPAPPPQRQAIEPAVQAITQARQMSADDLKATTGIYDSAMGAQSNEISGVAIQGRASQSQNSTFHFVDNLTRSMKHAGRIIVEIIPKIYDTARAARIIGDDGEHKIVMLNQTHKDESGKDVLYDVTKGSYDVTIDVGPSFASKRQEAATAMQEFTRAYPNLLQIAGDIMFRNMDVPGAQEIAERMKKMLPPQLQDAPNLKDIPPQVISQMKQMQMMIQQLSQHLNESTKIIETKKLDLEHKERVEMAKIQADIEINLAKLGAEGSQELLKQQVAELMQREKLLAMNQPIDAPQDFNAQTADGGNYAGFGHVGGSPTGGASPGQIPGANP